MCILLRSAIVLECSIMRDCTILRSRTMLWCVVVLKSWLLIFSLLETRRLLILLLHWCSLRSTIMHSFSMSWLLANKCLLLALPAFDFLVLLSQVAWSTATRHETIRASITLQAIPLSDFSSLHHLDDPVECAAGQSAVAETVEVEHAEVLELGILVESVMYSAVCDTWNAP
jgi:hypothetical protein